MNRLLWIHSSWFLRRVSLRTQSFFNTNRWTRNVVSSEWWNICTRKYIRRFVSSLLSHHFLPSHDGKYICRILHMSELYWLKLCMSLFDDVSCSVYYVIMYSNKLKLNRLIALIVNYLCKIQWCGNGVLLSSVGGNFEVPNNSFEMFGMNFWCLKFHSTSLTWINSSSYLFLE